MTTLYKQMRQLKTILGSTFTVCPKYFMACYIKIYKTSLNTQYNVQLSQLRLFKVLAYFLMSPAFDVKKDGEK